MKILHVTRSRAFTGGSNSFGGLDRAVQSLSKALREIGVLSDILYLEPETYAENSKEDLVAAHTDRAFQDRYDWVYFHDWYGALLAQSIYAGGFRNILVSAHLPVRRGFTYLDAERSFEEKAYMEGVLFDLAKMIISPSNFVAALLIQEYGLAGKKLRVLGHGVDPEVFYPTYAEENTPPTLLFVGRLERQKGIELLLYATRKVISNRPDIQLKIAGDGSLANTLPSVAQELGLSAHCEFLGQLDDDRLRTEYNSADLLVMPSIFEPFGLVGLESLSCGCNVLSISPTGADYLEPRQLTQHFSPSRLGVDILGHMGCSGRTEQSKNREQAALWTWNRSANNLANALGKFDGTA